MKKVLFAAVLMAALVSTSSFNTSARVACTSD
jgi:hypothetical protein